MASRIHKTDAGDTLQSIADQYQDLLRDTTRDLPSTYRVLGFIRAKSPTDLSSFADTDVLPDGTVLFIPTLRSVPTAVFTDHAALRTKLHASAIHHANAMLTRTLEVIKELVLPSSSYTEPDVEKAYALTAFLDLDGMDRYTALHLFEDHGITTMTLLAQQSPATIASILTSLVADEDRPAELTQQGHHTRWVKSARITLRTRLGERRKLRRFTVPIRPADAAQRAAHFEEVSQRADVPPGETDLAAHLALLHRFQAAVLAAHVSMARGQNRQAIQSYQDARTAFHRLAEAVGAVPDVDDATGLNMHQAIDTARRLLVEMEAFDDDPFGAPAPKLIFGRTRGRYGLKAFRFHELDTGSTNRQTELQTQITAEPIRLMPRRFRHNVDRSINTKTRAEFDAADGLTFLNGLASGAGQTVARDFEPQDRKVLRRNLGAAKVQTTYGSALNAFDSGLAVGDIKDLTGPLWNGLVATDVLSTAAQANYPAAFLARSDVTPFTRFIVLPGSVVMFPVVKTPQFITDYEELVLKPRMISPQASAATFDDEVWASSSAFAAITPYLYGVTMPLGLRRCYTATRQHTGANRFGALRTNVWDAGGTLQAERHSLPPGSPILNDVELSECAEPFELQLVLGEWVVDLAAADDLYRHDDRVGARARYLDAKCKIEQAFPEYAGIAQQSLVAVDNQLQMIAAGTVGRHEPFHSALDLTTLAATNTATGLPVVDWVEIVEADPEQAELSLTERVDIASRYFELLMPTEDFQLSVEHAAEENPLIAGAAVRIGCHVLAYVNATHAGDYYPDYLNATTKILAIDCGLNWFGFLDDYVPPWSYDHLRSVAQGLAAHAVEAEQRVLSLIEAYEAAQTDELLAAQAATLAGAEAIVAAWQVQSQAASNTVSALQAELTVHQTEAQKNRSAVGAWVAGAVTLIGTTALVIGTAGAAGVVIPTAIAAVQGPLLAVGGAGTIVSGATGLANSATGHGADVEAYETAQDIAAATNVANAYAMGVAIAQQDVAELRADQASEYLEFLQDQTLDSNAYAGLVALAREETEIYLHHATRMAWLAQRALIHQTRREFDLIKLDYGVGDEITDMTRARQLQRDLELLNSEYVAGDTIRRQEVKWNIALSQLDPIAWRDLREKGEGHFMLRQEMIDRFFPGTYLHSLKDVRLTFLGLLPPTGVRGVLSSPGVSWTRVPVSTVERSACGGNITTKPDWVTAILEGTANEYEQYEMKLANGGFVSVSLSEFDVRSDRAVLAVPQGQLTSIQHHGLDSAWTLRVPKQSNDFDPDRIIDVEFTFWFLCAYDEALEGAQVDAYEQLASTRDLTAAVRRAFMAHDPDQWAAFLGPRENGEAVDARRLVWDLTEDDLRSTEANHKLKNIALAVARRPDVSAPITLRICHDQNPVGKKLASVEDAVYTLFGIDLAVEGGPGGDPTPVADPDLSAFVFNQFYSGGDPDAPPTGRWVLKFEAGEAGSDWKLKDEDGVAVKTVSGPLEADAAGDIAIYNSGSWSDLSLTFKLRHRGSSVRIWIRGNDALDTACYAEIDRGVLPGPTPPPPTPAVRVGTWEGGTFTQAAERLMDSDYPASEFIEVDFRAVGETLTLRVDGITLLSVAVPAALGAGSIALEVMDRIDSPVHACEFDDLVVRRLTGLGADREVVLDEPFTTTLPTAWTFTGAWAIGANKHEALDLSGLGNLVLELQYEHDLLT